MRQTNINWIKANAYNLHLLTDLIKRVHDATEQTGIVYYGWVTDDPAEDGIISMVGMVSAGDLPPDPVFLYTETILQDHLARIRSAVMGLGVHVLPEPGTFVMATVTTPFCARGSVGEVIEERAPNWPASFSVKWQHSGKISYLADDEYVKVTMQ